MRLLQNPSGISQSQTADGSTNSKPRTMARTKKSSKKNQPSTADEGGAQGGGDWLDSLCEPATDKICPGPSEEQIRKEAASKQPGEPVEKDALDVVFDGVETYTCNGAGCTSDETTTTTKYAENQSDLRKDYAEIMDIESAKTTASIETVDEANREGTFVITSEKYCGSSTWYNERGYQLCACTLCFTVCVLVAMIVLFFTR